MKRLCDGADTLQGSFQEAGQVAHGPRARQREALERCVMSAAEDPGLIRRASSVGTKHHEITPRFNQALTAAHLLGENVAEHAALFLLEVVESGTQLVKNAPRNEGGGGQLGIGVLKLLAGTQAEILVDADVAEAGIALQVLDALRCQQQELLDLGVIGLP